MCFSASASFAASAVLMGAGVAAVRKTTSATQLPFASVPLLFSLQQFSEGVLWMALDHPGWAFLYAPAMHFFFFIAMAVWPLWIPLSVWRMETDARVRRKMRWSLDLGILLFGYFAFCQLFFGVQANGDCYHIAYFYQYPFENIARVAYMLAVIPAFFFFFKKVYAGPGSKRDDLIGRCPGLLPGVLPFHMVLLCRFVEPADALGNSH